jgi:c-di-GMP-binding flagellar brake protein YcgR
MWDGINRRRFPRADYPCLIRVRKKRGKETLGAKTENIGVGGIYVILEKDLGLFSMVELELDLQDGMPAIKVEGTVVWVVRRHEIKKDRTGYFDTGVEFKNLAPANIARIEAIVDKCLEREQTQG